MTLDAWELARRTDLCIGCERVILDGSGRKGGGLWCEACKREGRRTGTLPDLLAGGAALRRGPLPAASSTLGDVRKGETRSHTDSATALA